MPWLQAQLTVDKGRAPLIELLFENLGAVAVTMEDAGDEPMLEPAPGETPLWQATRITGLFEGDTDADSLRSTINQALAADVSRHLVLERLADQDWERAWMDQFHPMQFGRRLWIRPSGNTITQPDAVIVDLDPGLAFGTGTHPTTALCLRWLDGQDLHGRTVIDFGCGSGVLGIAALKLGAARVVAVDHDPQAVLATRDNAARNAVDDRIEVLHSDGFADHNADLVMANILANVLITLAPKIQRLVKPGGTLVMSGVLQAQADDVMRAYADSLDFRAIQTQDDWVLLHGSKRP
ncbi:MAG TPA: 50S ribosomal protein L11 methyltransferase [Gammaproteobacteria bacterium]|nr:50S ribosomal protein L11 methyltransferase [Chromatiaceae bacterium]MCP5435497.1 50S ribosomal protein L11 methyltransferase [Chromatiaceae bacterium]MCW5587876.1 50S ribosomal protein L11 methyltransferase [Chromatiales bacterium]HOP17424.1 50S ribosomal protein L11 methyltransferase [Gammaproteobacteria bacterium]